MYMHTPAPTRPLPHNHRFIRASLEKREEHGLRVNDKAAAGSAHVSFGW